MFEVNDGDFVTLAHLTLLSSTYGAWVHNASTSFAASYLTATGSGLDGIRIEADAVGAAVDHLTVPAPAATASSCCLRRQSQR